MDEDRLDNTARVDRWLVRGLIAIVVIIGGGIAWSEASGHEAPASVSMPLGWSYGIECCSNKDCARSKAGEITTTDKGFRVNSTGEIIPYNDRRIKRSRDEYYHRCAPAGDFTRDRSLCLYVPDFGF
jgi:hypothetical protein